MSAAGLGSRAIIGEFHDRLEANPGARWVNGVSMMFDSDQASEEYKWLGMSPAMREWVGGRLLKGLRENGITIENLHYEASINVFLHELRRDKTGQILTRIRELADRTNSHWASLLSTLIINGESTACYDGQFFFDTDHSEGDSGTQDNDLSIDISTLPVNVNGSVTAPSVAEMQNCILQAIQQIFGFVDDQGEPLNEDATDFIVMVPTTLWHPAAAAVSVPMLDTGQSNVIPNLGGLNLSVVPNPRLNSSWTDQFAVFRTGGNVSPFIRQQETPVELDVIAEGSELEKTEKRHMYGVDTWRNVGYGFWQHACLVTMI